MVTDTTAFRSRIVGHEDVDPEQLVANPRNWRIHPRRQQDALKGVLEDVGWVQSVVVNRQTGFVVDGHARVALAIRHNEPTVPVTYVDLSAEEEALILATLDPIGALAVADADAVHALLSELDYDADSLSSLIDQLADDRSDLTMDHTRLIFDDEDGDNPWSTDRRTAEAERYDTTTVRQIVLLFDREGYVRTLLRIRALADRHGLETNGDVVRWLLDQHVPMAEVEDAVQRALQKDDDAPA